MVIGQIGSNFLANGHGGFSFNSCYHKVLDVLIWWQVRMQLQLWHIIAWRTCSCVCIEREREREREGGERSVVLPLISSNSSNHDDRKRPRDGESEHRKGEIWANGRSKRGGWLNKGGKKWRRDKEGQGISILSILFRSIIFFLLWNESFLRCYPIRVFRDLIQPLPE